jgi:4-hydroxy-2-oxoheptanedioate aldolase
MSLPRLNGWIRALESGRPAIAMFAPCDIETAIALQHAPLDGLVFEGEHAGWDIAALRTAMQFLLNRQQILHTGTPAPALTPIARIPANGVEMNQYLAKQALDLGCYGIMWPHVSTVAQAYNAVSACRYPRLKHKPLYEPAGIRGDGPTHAVRYWGVTRDEYYARADVWPLAPQGEIICVILIEDLAGIANLPDILREVPGIGAVLIGGGDLAQELGYPRQSEHETVRDAMAQIVSTCKEFGVPVGHPQTDASNIERVLAEGYRLLIGEAPRSFAALQALRSASPEN